MNHKVQSFLTWYIRW